MALIKFGMMMTDARGKLGGQVFTKTRSGATLRTKVVPANPRSTAQQFARGILGSLSAQWKSLTEEQRLAWNSAVQDYSRTNIFGDTYLPSGKNLFTALNSNLLHATLPQILTPQPSIDVPFAIVDDVQVKITDGEIVLNIVTDIPGAGYQFVIQATKPMSAGRFNFSGSYTTLSVTPGTAYPSDGSLYLDYVAKYGVPPIGSKIGFKVFVIAASTGQKATPSSANGIASLV